MCILEVHLKLSLKQRKRIDTVCTDVFITCISLFSNWRLWISVSDFNMLVLECCIETFTRNMINQMTLVWRNHTVSKEISLCQSSNNNCSPSYLLIGVSAYTLQFTLLLIYIYSCSLVKSNTGLVMGTLRDW